MSASVKSVEDHGYILNLGVPELSGFLSFKDVKKSLQSSSSLPVGRIVDVSISKVSSNGRTCNVTVAPLSIRASYVCSPDVFTSSFLVNLDFSLMRLPT
jgi:rRNA biogenesis protein RRP5